MIRLADAAASEALGARLAALARPGDVIALSGTLGAGKTSIARGLLAALGLEGEAPSPSFAIVQPYAPPEVRFPVLHVDLYRIDDPGETEELGLDDARYDSLLIVEWPERLPVSVWSDALWLTLTIEPDGARSLTAQVPAAWKDRWFPT
jgi:tRNA threonylcarbamoyladenosine biosynthesis protein TsaE